jgi:two-component sensor histidine kinase
LKSPIGVKSPSFFSYKFGTAQYLSMKTPFYIWVFCCLGASLFGQTPIDSLKSEIIMMPDDTQKVWTYHALARNYLLVSFDSCTYYLDKSLKLSEKLDYPKGVAYSLLRMSGNNMFKGEREREAALLRRGLEIARENNIHEVEANFISKIGKMHMEDMLLDSALYYFQKAEKTNTENGMSDNNWSIYNNIGGLYERLSDYEKAEVFFTKSYDITKRKEDRMNFGMSLYFLLQANLKSQDYEDYSNYLEEYLVFSQKGKKQLQLDNFHATIFFEKTDNRDDKIKSLNQTVAAHKRLGNMRSFLTASIILSELYATNKQIERGAEILEEAFVMAEEVEIPEFEILTANTLSDYYYKAGNADKAYRYLLTAKTIGEELGTKEALQNLKELEVKYETEKKEIEIARQQLALEKAEVEKNSLTALIFAAGLLTLILAYFLYFKQKTNKVLARKNETIQNALEEKEILLKEIHHRVKNNLQIVSSLLNLQSRTLENESARLAIRDGQNRVKSMALIHQNLYRSDSLTSMDVREYVSKLSENLYHSYNISPGQIKLSNEVESFQMDVEILVPLGLILNELVSNSLKHAFPDGRTGEVKVALYKKDNNYHMEVSDNGIGMDQEANAEKKQDSFGLRMIHAFCDKLKANLSFINQEGTRVELSIPVKA